jgi:hypothetical protein
MPEVSSWWNPPMAPVSSCSWRASGDVESERVLGSREPRPSPRRSNRTGCRPRGGQGLTEPSTASTERPCRFVGFQNGVSRSFAVPPGRRRVGGQGAPGNGGHVIGGSAASSSGSPSGHRRCGVGALMRPPLVAAPQSVYELVRPGRGYELSVGPPRRGRASAPWASRLRAGAPSRPSGARVRVRECYGLVTAS